MPFYEFKCKSCEKQYEVLTPHDKTGKYKKIKCEFCGSTKKEQLIGLTSFSFGNPVGTDIWTSDSQGHDYRYKYNLPNVIAERERAERLSHVGANPYNDIPEDENHDLGIFDNDQPIRLEVPE